MTLHNVLLLVVAFFSVFSACYRNLARDELPLCAQQCGAMTRTRFNRNCPWTSEECVCNFIDSYTLCAMGRCIGSDRAAAIHAPLSFFVPESMLVSDENFDPMCLGDQSIVDNSESKLELKEADNVYKTAAPGAATVIKGDGIVIAPDRKGGITATVEDLESAQINPDYKITIARARAPAAAAARANKMGNGSTILKTSSNLRLLTVNVGLVIVFLSL